MQQLINVAIDQLINPPAGVQENQFKNCLAISLRTLRKA